MLLNQILNLPVNDNKFYALTVSAEVVKNSGETFESLVFAFKDKIVLLGVAYAPFYFEIADRLHFYEDFTYKTLSFYDLVEIPKDTALDCFRFFIETGHNDNSVFLSPDIEKQFVIDAVLHYADSFGSLLSDVNKDSIKNVVSNITPVDDERPRL